MFLLLRALVFPVTLCGMVGWFVSDELRKIWKEAALSRLKVMRKVSRCNRDSNRGSPEYKSDVHPPERAAVTDCGINSVIKLEDTTPLLPKLVYVFVSVLYSNF
jgi:hypothetical protein